MYFPGQENEPYCTHTLQGEPHQPASMCRICKDGPELADWIKYWDLHHDEIPPHLKIPPHLRKQAQND